MLFSNSRLLLRAISLNVKPNNMKADINTLSRMAALTFVTARAFNLWNAKLEQEVKKLQQCHTYDTRFALRQIADGCAKISRGLEHFDDWGISAGITQSGHSGDCEAVDAFLNDGAWVAVLSGLAFNACAENDTARTIIESYCKSQVKGKPLIPYEIINSLKPTL